MEEIKGWKTRYCELFERNIKREGSKELLEMIKKSDFFTAPASTRFHHSEEGGLVRHSVEVYDYLMRLVDSFALDDEINVESITIVSLLHDLCKLGFYKVSSRNTKDENGKWIQVPYYEIDDKLPLGHSEKSIIMILQYMKLEMDEIFAINCHMGGFDDRKYTITNGFNESKLAVLLHLADIASTYDL